MSDRNPFALGDRPEPMRRRIAVGDTTLYVEEQGSGAAVMLIGAADEDAEFYRGIADRLAPDCRVVTYDRRGTRRSGREGWPCAAERHADDVAELIDELELDRVTVLGASAGGLVALAVALRHPDLVETVLCFEPGVLCATEEGAALADAADAAVAAHLDAHPHDWPGAVHALGRVAARSSTDGRDLFAAPEGDGWFARRADANAEALVRGDLPLTQRAVDLEAVARCPTNVRFAYGTASLPVFREIATRLAACRHEVPDALHGLGHSVYHHPDTTVEYVRRWL